MNHKTVKSIELNRLPFYSNRLIIVSLVLAMLFLLFIYQQWTFINAKETVLEQYHLPCISTAFQLKNELNGLNPPLAHDDFVLQSKSAFGEFNNGIQTQFSYKRKILSNLLARLDDLQKGMGKPGSAPTFKRMARSVNALVETLKQNEIIFRPESVNVSWEIRQVIIRVEQFRRLHEHMAKHVRLVLENAYQYLWLSSSIAGGSLLFMWGVLIYRSSSIIKHAIKKQQQTEQKITESQQLLQAILNHASTCVSLKDLNGHYLFINRQYEILFNIKNETLKGKTDYVVHSPEIASKLVDNDKQVVQTQDYMEFEETLRHYDGGTHIYMTVKFPLFDQQGKVYAICGMSTDITKRKDIELKLRKLNLAVEQSPNLVLITNLHGVIEYVNNKITDLTGYLPEEVIGKTPHIFKTDKTPLIIYQELWETITSGREWRGVLQNKKKNGEVYWAQESIAPVKNDAQQITHFVAIQEDVTSARELTEKLSYQAEHDALTGLINRQAFERRLERVLITAKENQSEHALCYLDLDQFKIVNDSCSHAAGDELLRQLSKEFGEVIRHRDTIGRLGGDEFAVLMEHCSLEQARHKAEEFLELTSKFQFVWDNKRFRVGVSIGLIPITSQSTGIGELLKQADIACYAAKDAGRNRIHVFLQHDDEYIKNHHGEMDWVGKITYALENDRFILYAQPITPLRPGLEPHYEILIRMLGENDEIIAPGAFLPAVERYHLSQKIDRWVIHKTFMWIKENPVKYHKHAVFSVNLSGQNLGDKLLLDFIYQEFESTGIDFKNICFEITETATIFNLSTASDFIISLKRAGCKFSIDDFGSGLSSFDYLKKLPVDYLKIDGNFVKDIADDLVDMALVKSINEIGHVMGKQTIAEFVENQDILDVLNKIGVDFAQGYHLGKPEPLDSLEL